MKTPTLLRGVFAAVVLSLTAAAAFSALSHLANPRTALEATIALTAGAYLFWLVSKSETRIGRLTTIVGWSIGAGVLWFGGASLALYLLAHVAMIWLIRALYFHASVLPALIDLGLSALAVGGALWALEQTSSVFLAVWSFYLVQSFFVVIPQTLVTAPSVPDPTFQRAQRMAEAALRRISASS